MNKTIYLSLARKSVPIRFDVVQHATLPAITFVLEDYTPSVSAVASLYIKKPDGTQIYNDCTITDNQVTYEPTTQSFAEVGTCTCQLQIIEPNDVALSFLMYADVTPDTIDSEAIESTDEFTRLEAAIQEIGDLTSLQNRVSAVEAVGSSNTSRLDNLGNEKLTFSEATVDTTISDNLTLSTIFGRIKRLFTRTTNVESAVTIEDSVLTAFENDGWTRPSGGVISSLFNYVLNKIKNVSKYNSVSVTINTEYITTDNGYTAYIQNNILFFSSWFKIAKAIPESAVIYTFPNIKTTRRYFPITRMDGTMGMGRMQNNQNTIATNVAMPYNTTYHYINIVVPLL